MNPQKPTYRFFVTFLVVAVFVAMVAPVAQGRGVVNKLCNLPSGEQPMSMSMNGWSSQQAINSSVDESNNDSCRTVDVYLCCLSESPVGTKATPISQTISSKIVALQVVVINQPTVSSPPVSSIEQQFIEAITSSPPLFLQNSSFLN